MRTLLRAAALLGVTACATTQHTGTITANAASPPSATALGSGGAPAGVPVPSHDPHAQGSSENRTPLALSRQAVHEAVQKGLGAFLQRVDIDDHPVFAGGKFKGFRIAALRGDAFWRGVDLRPGDVVMRLNGFPIERPEQAQTAFESLDVASELRVDFEREGQPHTLIYAIIDGR